MTQATHTPGPWIVSHAGSGQNGVFVIDELYVTVDGADVAIAADIADPTTAQKSEANARLIAAAPTLLMALEFLLDQAESFNVSGVYFSAFRENRDALDTARDAIAKATGSAA